MKNGKKVELACPKRFLPAVNATLRACEDAERPIVKKAVPRVIKISQKRQSQIARMLRHAIKDLLDVEKEVERIEDFMADNDETMRKTDMLWYERRLQEFMGLLALAGDIPRLEP